MSGSPGPRPRRSGRGARVALPALVAALSALSAGGAVWAITSRDAATIASARTETIGTRLTEEISRLVDERLAAARLLAGDPLLVAAAGQLEEADPLPGPEARPDPARLAALEESLAPTHLIEPHGPASRRLGAAVATLPGATSALLTNARGVCAAGSDPVHTAWVGGARWWRAAITNGFDVSLPGDDRDVPVDTFAVSVRIPGADRRAAPLGVVRILYGLDVLRAPLRRAEPISPALVSRDRRFLRAGAEETAPLESDAALADLAPRLAPGADLSSVRPKVLPVPIDGASDRWWVAARPLRPEAPPVTLVLLAAAAGAGVVAIATRAAAAGTRRAVAGDLAALAAWTRTTGEEGRTVPPPQTKSVPEMDDVGRALAEALEPLRSARVELGAARRSLEERLNARGLELARMSQELQRRTEELAAASRGKEEFVRVVTHELRTPLNSILGLTQLVRDGAADSPEEARSYLDQVLGSARELLKVVNGVLEVTRLESGRVELEPGEVDVAHVAEEVRLAAAEAAAGKGLVLRLAVDPDLPRAWADGPRLRQVLAALVDNAIKFTQTGGVLVRVRASDGKRKLLFEVEDTGVGIPEERRSLVFEKFIQGETGAARRFGGTGLGLPIARLLVEAMGGRIGLEPGAGGIGTRAWFTVPTPGREGR